MFAQHDLGVRQANLQCVQSLNELWDALGELEKRTLDGTAEIFIRNPLKPMYDLYCFTKSDAVAGTGSGESVAVRRVALTLRPPLELTRQHGISSPSAQKSLARVTQLLVSFFVDAGVPKDALPVLESPASASSVSGGRSEADSQPLPSRRQLDAANAQMDAIVFDRAVSARHFAAATPAFKSALASTPSPSAASILSRKRASQSLQQSCDAYLRSGRVLVQGLELHEEAAALDRLRAFLLDYGGVLNFSHQAWAAVVVVLAKTPPQADGGGERSTTGRVGGAAGRGRRALQSFRCERRSTGPGEGAAGRGELSVLHVPHLFRAGDMLEFLRTSLPQTNPFATGV